MSTITQPTTPQERAAIERWRAAGWTIRQEKDGIWAHAPDGSGSVSLGWMLTSAPRP